MDGMFVDNNTPDTINNSNYTNQRNDLAGDIWKYGSPILLVTGSIGNTLSFLVMLRSSLRRHTTSSYLTVLAVVDTAVLYTGLLRHWIKEISGIDVRNLSAGGCKTHIFLVYFLMQLESWIIVLVTVERLVAVFVPHRAKRLLTKKTAFLQISATALLLTATDLHFMFGYKLVEDSCSPSTARYKYFMEHVWNWIDFVLASMAPFVLMLSMNIAIIIRLFHPGNKHRRNTGAPGMARKNSMTGVLLAVNFVFLFTTAPIVIYLCTEGVARANSEKDLERLDVVWACVNMAAYSNNAINFILYSLSGPTFRQEVVKLLHLSRFTNRVKPADNIAVSTV